MKTRYLPLVVLLTVPAWVAACAETPPADPPPQPPAAVVTAEPAAVAPVVTAEPAPPVVEPPAPPPKPGKEKIVGKWQFAFEGEPKARAEEEAKKKFPKDKDQAKRDAYLAKIADAAAGEWIEFVDGAYVSHVTNKGKDKVVFKIKYDVSKDESSAIVMKPNGKDEISKKEAKDEVSISFAGDDTINMMDPKKKMTLTFKRK